MIIMNLQEHRVYSRYKII